MRVRVLFLTAMSDTTTNHFSSSGPEEEQLDADPTQRREPPRRGGAGDPGVRADQPRARQQELARAREVHLEAAVGVECVSRHAWPRGKSYRSSISYAVGENIPLLLPSDAAAVD
jgi:hypothetical protein